MALSRLSQSGMFTTMVNNRTRPLLIGQIPWSSCLTRRGVASLVSQGPSSSLVYGRGELSRAVPCSPAMLRKSYATLLSSHSALSSTNQLLKAKTIAPLFLFSRRSGGIHTYSFVNLSQNPERFISEKAPMKRATKLYLILALSLIAYCIYSIDTVPFSGRYRCVLIPQKWESFLGAAFYEATVGTQIAADKQEMTEQSLKILEQFELIVQSHCEHILASNGLLYQWDWKFAVSPESTVNALTFPGGNVVMNFGSLQILVQNGVLNEGEMAAILAHEFGHAVARHTAEVVSLIMPINILIVTMTNIFGSSNSASTVFDLLVSLPASRRNEREADLIGLKMMAIAGYDPKYALSVHERLLEIQGKDVQFAYNSTHPLEQDRLAFIEKLMPEANELFLKSNKTPPSFAKPKPPPKRGWF